MSAFSDNLEQFAATVGQEVGSLRELLNDRQADLSALTTTDKTNLVAAINELRQLILQSTSIDDSLIGVNTTWSSQKIVAEIDLAIVGLQDGVDASLDTLAKIADAIGGDVDYVQIFNDGLL